MIRVGVNGYGTIGKRVADAVAAQPDMAVAGVAKTRPNHEARAAVDRGYALYAAVPERAPGFAEEGIDIAGPVEDLVDASDVVVDATPSGVGAGNRPLYESASTPALFQGGESADLAGASFNARSNYDDAVGADLVRVVSCNTTGLARLIAPLREVFGIQKVRATLVRRGGDPAQSGRGPIDDILPNPLSLPSHHGPDVRTVLPGVDIDTAALKVPATLMHVHLVNVTFDAPIYRDDVLGILEDEPRLLPVTPGLGIEGTAALKEFAKDRDRPRGDLWENAVWSDSITVEGEDLYLFQAIHQESNVVPENVDAIRAVTDAASASESMASTEDALGIGF